MADLPAKIFNTGAGGQPITLRARSGSFYDPDRTYVIAVGETLEISAADYPYVQAEVEALEARGLLIILEQPTTDFSQPSSQPDLQSDPSLQTKGPVKEVEIQAPFLILEPRNSDPLTTQGAPDGTMWFIQGPTVSDPVDVRVRLSGTVYSLLAGQDGSTLLTVLAQLIFVNPPIPLVGVVDGDNTTFLTPHAFEPTTITPFINGQAMPEASFVSEEVTLGTGYTRIVFARPPQIESEVRATYLKRIAGFFP